MLHVAAVACCNDLSHLGVAVASVAHLRHERSEGGPSVNSRWSHVCAKGLTLTAGCGLASALWHAPAPLEPLPTGPHRYHSSLSGALCHDPTMQWSASSGDADESSAQCADEIGTAAVGARMHIGSLTCRGRGTVAARFPPPIRSHPHRMRTAAKSLLTANHTTVRLGTPPKACPQSVCTAWHTTAAAHTD